jgi:hypothetical protein
MIYVSIDLETTGLETENHQILSIGAVIEDTTKPEIAVEDLPTFHGIIVHNELTGSPFALNMNRDLIEKMSIWQNTKEEARKEVEKMTGMSFFMENEIVEGLFQFFYRNGIGPDYKNPGDHLKGAVKKGEDGIMYPALTSNMPKVHLTAAGKNFATFDLKFLERLPRWKQVFKVRQRIIDPSVLFTNWREDESLPGLSLCKTRAKMDGHVAHDAVEDARDIIRLLRTQYS